MRKIATVLILILFSTSALAENDDWSNDKIKLEELVAQGKCDEYWPLLWPWAKKGELEARDILFTASAVQLHSPEIYPPGRYGDSISHMRDILILMIHSMPQTSISEENNEARRYLETSFIAELKNTPRAKRFLQCWENDGSQKCSVIAVEDRLIPSWDSYASEIDALIDKGFKSICIKSQSPY